MITTSFQDRMRAGFQESIIIIVLSMAIRCATLDCQGHKVVFTSEPSNIEVALSPHAVAHFSCEYIGGRGNETKLEWIINSKSYPLIKLPPNHVALEKGTILYVTNITSMDNNSIYQCLILAGNREIQNQCAYRSKIGKLMIQSNGFANGFIEVSFDKAISSINCTFINQPRKSEKYCLVKYGTAIPRCQFSSQVKGHVANSNSIFMHLILEDATTICYNVEAGNSSRIVRIGGSLTLESFHGKNNIQAQVYITALVPVVITALSVLGTTLVIFYLVGRQPKKSLNLLEEYDFDGPSKRYLPQQYDVLSLSGSYACHGLPKSQWMALTLPPLEIPVDRATSYYTIHIVTEDKCLMYKFTTEHYPDYQPQDGFGYYQLTNKQMMSISPHKRVIVMDKKNPSLPTYVTTGSNLKKNYNITRENSLHVYAQDKSFTRVLNSGSKVLCYFPSEAVTAYTKMYDVTEPCTSKQLIPHHKPEWTRYGYFELTNPEEIKPDQRVIALKHGGTLVTGLGIRQMLGTNGDGATAMKASDFERVFIQSREDGRTLEPGTKYLFCAMMDKIREYYTIYDVPESCSMTSFAKGRIPGFEMEGGYGYYEFREAEFIKPHRNVILVDEQGRLFTGAGARFFYTGCEYDMDAVLKKKRVPPPNLDGTHWTHIFVQSYSTKRILKQGTKFLYCEYHS